MVDARRWSHVAEAYRRSFASLCAGTIPTILADLGSPTPGGLLDVGCGAGALARAAAECGWTTTATDIDRDMLDLTRVECAGLPVPVMQTALPQLGLAAGAHDAAVANFVVNHLPDPRAGVRDLARVVRPGGLVALTTWTNQRTAQAALFADALEVAGARPVPGQRLPPELDFERSVTGLAGITQQAGLEPVIARELRWTWAVPWPDLWAGISGGVASIGETYLAQDAATRDRVRQAMRDRAAESEVDGRVQLPSIAAYVVARRPG